MNLTINDPPFWNEDLLKRETIRIFDKCHGCRLCYQLCPSFNYLFDTIDKKDDRVENLDKADFERIEKLCFQCKLCFPKCPYVPPHEWGIDFPRLMLRAKLVRVKREGIPLADKIMGFTDIVGKIGSMAAPLVNFANRLGVARMLMHQFAGIHKNRNLPVFHHETFAAWIQKNRPDYLKMKNAPGDKVALFYTCFVNYNAPNIGRAIIQVLEKNKLNVYIPGQMCCGMPHLDGGNVAAALKNVNKNINALYEAVEAGYTIISPQPTCTYMLKIDYPWLTGTEQAKKIARSTRDFTEYLWELHLRGKFNTDFKNKAGNVVYHVPCHLKAQNIGFKSRDIMKLIPETKVQIVDKCSGHDGTWSMKKEYFELSLIMGEKLFNGIRKSQSDEIVSDCSLAGLQIKAGTNRDTRHPAEILADAYGLNSF